MNVFTNQLLQRMRQQTDPLADEVIAQLFSDKAASKHFRELLAKPMANQAPLPALPDYLTVFFEETAQLPDWADQALMRQGHEFFETNSQEIMALLGYLSLPYCYAAADGARVLWLSERIHKNTAVRLSETAQFVFDVMDENAFEATGYGIRSIQKVRLVHAAVRYHTLRSGKWDSEAWGLPVNQEDMAGTNMAFSTIILRGLRKMGKAISHQDAEAYLHYWSVIGSMLGIQPELIPENGKEAFWLTKKIGDRTIRKSEAGTALTKALLESFDEDPPVKLPDGFHPSLMRFVLGDQIADVIGLPQPNWTRFMVQQQKLFNTVMGTFEGKYQREKAKKQLAFIKKNTIERISSEKAFNIPLSLKD